MRQATIALILLLFSTITGNYLMAQHSSSSKDGVYVSLQVGVNLDRMKTAGNQVDYLKFGNSIQPSLSALVDFDLEDLKVDELKGLIIRLEADYKPLHFRANGYAGGRYEDYQIKASTIAPLVSALYRVPWLGKLRPYGGIGIGFIVSNISKNTLTIHDNKIIVYDNNFDLNGDNFLIAYTAGLMLGKKYDLNFKVLKSKWSRPDDIQHQLRNRSLILSFGRWF